MLALGLMVFFLVVRPMVRQVMVSPREMSGVRVLQEEVPQLEGKAEVPRIEEPRITDNDRIVHLAQSSPEQFAQHLRVWISEEHGR
jgi:flagellar biosynthesis/type III secretory pathway M-ring protein FliF/YscJ